MVNFDFDLKVTDLLPIFFQKIPLYIVFNLYKKLRVSGGKHGCADHNSQISYAKEII